MASCVTFVLLMNAPIHHGVCSVTLVLVLFQNCFPNLFVNDLCMRLNFNQESDATGLQPSPLM